MEMMEIMPREAAADDKTTLMVTATVESTVRVSSTKKPSSSGSGNSPRQTPPLTTTFTPPSACLNELWQTKSASHSWLHLGPFNSTECLPSGWAPSMYFSPGVCPSGWVIAGQSTTSTGGADETIATCCPKYLESGWEFNTLPKKKNPPPWVSSEICQWSPKSKVSLVYSENTKGGYSAKTIPFGTTGFINAYGLEVRWRSSDQASAATATATETSADTDSEAAETSSSGLSPGAKAGVGVGVAVGGLAILFAVAFFLLRRRKQRANAAGNTRNTGGAAELETPEAGAAIAAQEKKDAEPYGRAPVELPSNHVSEIDGYKVTPRSPSNDPVELDASSPR